MSNQENWTPNQFRDHHNAQLAAQGLGSRSKYKNVRREVDGITFHSIKESDYFGRLKIRQQAGHIMRFERQVIYNLEVNGHVIAKYIADFVIYFHDGTVQVIDVKSKGTEDLPVFKMKKKLMKAIYGIEIQIA